jgi:hypothetical protein
LHNSIKNDLGHRADSQGGGSGNGRFHDGKVKSNPPPPPFCNMSGLLL